MVRFKLEVPGSTKRFLEAHNSEGNLSDKFESRRVDSEAMKNYMNCFEEWYAAQEQINYIDAYKIVINYIPILVNPKSIQYFVREVENSYEKLPYYAGLFISYLFNELCSEKEIALKINEPWSFLGNYNTKSLRIDGDCRDWCGYKNEGEIVVNGDCADSCGVDMSNGKITVKEDISDYIGRSLKGGEIYLNGDYRSIGRHFGGKIYHKGNLIYENGVRVI